MLSRVPHMEMSKHINNKYVMHSSWHLMLLIITETNALILHPLSSDNTTLLPSEYFFDKGVLNTTCSNSRSSLFKLSCNALLLLQTLSSNFH